MKKSLILLGFLAHVLQSGMTQCAEFSTGIMHWSYSMEGEVRSAVVGPNKFPFTFSERTDLNPFVVIEPNNRYLPNLRLQHNNIQSKGAIGISSPVFTGGELILVDGDFDFSHTGLMLYYGLLDQSLQVDVGISGKYFGGHQRFDHPTVIQQELDFDHVIPMLFVQGQVELINQRLWLNAVVETLSFDGNEVTDLHVALQYRFRQGHGLDLGYRVLDLDLSNISSIKTDASIEGIYLSGYIQF